MHHGSDLALALAFGMITGLADNLGEFCELASVSQAQKEEEKGLFRET